MPNKHGDFIWYELLSNDADQAQKFYGDILGWRVRDSGQKDMDYRLFEAKDTETGDVHEVGGLMQISKEMKAGGARPAWLGYIAVDNVDEAVDGIVKAGGSVLMKAFDIPDVGRTAMVADPEGAPFYVMRGTGAGTSLAFSHDRPRPGHCAWNELATSDPKAALKFYSDMFGWTKDGEMDLGPMGAYEFLRHGALIGAIMRKPASLPAPEWTYYFRVTDIDSAVEKTAASGGQVVQGPNEIPGGGFTIKGIDPQGAPFALVGGRS